MLLQVYVEQKAWTRVAIDGKPHAHGFGLGGTEIRTANAVHCKKGILEVSGGVKELTVRRGRCCACTQYCSLLCFYICFHLALHAALAVVPCWSQRRNRHDLKRQ